MLLEMFINFDGECRAEVEFYAKVFKAPIGNLMTYGDMPPNADYPVSDADRDRIMYAGIPFGNMVCMFMDVPSGAPFVKGNNISPTFSTEDKNEVRRIFAELQECGTVNEELSPTFFSELYGAVTDKFGVVWQVLYYKAEDK